MKKEKKEEYIKTMTEYESKGDYSAHILKNRKRLKDITFDENYDYTFQNSKMKRFISNVCSNTIGFFILPIYAIFCNRIKIVGKKNLKGIKGYVSICNHNFLYDTLLCYRAIFSLTKKTWIISLEENIQMPIGKILRALGVIPIPRTHPSGLKKFTRCVDNELKHNNHIHIMPEGSLWMYYNKLRPFLSGAANYAVRNDVPLVPLCIGKRGETKFLKKDKLTLYVGTPLQPDTTVKKSIAVEQLNTAAHKVIEEQLQRHYTRYSNVKL